MQIATAASIAAVIVGKGFPSAWTGAQTRSLTGWPESLRGRSEFSVGIKVGSYRMRAANCTAVPVCSDLPRNSAFPSRK